MAMSRRIQCSRNGGVYNDMITNKWVKPTQLIIGVYNDMFYLSNNLKIVFPKKKLQNCFTNNMRQWN